MPATIVNLQRKIRLETKPVRGFVDGLAREVPEADGKEFAVALVSDRRMRELNKFFRDKDSTTDVLSFPYEADSFLSPSAGVAIGFPKEEDSGHDSQPPVAAGGTKGNPVATAPGSDLADEPASFLGDIVISVEQAKRQADENGITLENEINQLVLHGVLHLCGYDHETDQGEMNAREIELREKLGI